MKFFRIKNLCAQKILEWKQIDRLVLFKEGLGLVIQSTKFDDSIIHTKVDRRPYSQALDNSRLIESTAFWTSKDLMDTIMDMQVDLPADGSVEKPNGLTPLHMAAIKGDLAAVRLALAHLPDLLDMMDSTGATALRWAVMLGNEDVAVELLAANADYTINEHLYEQTLLRVAAYGKLGNFVDLLIRKSSSLKHPLSEAEENGQKLLIAVINRDTMLVQGILQKVHLDTEVRDENGKTALLLSVDYGDIGVVEQLLCHGVDCNVQDTTNEDTALHLAVENGRHDIVKLLLYHGADAHKLNSDYDLPLYFAVEQNNASIIKLLLEHDAKFGRGFVDYTATLRLACETGQLQTIYLLAKLGIEVQNFTFGYEDFNEEMMEQERDRVKVLLDLYFGS